MECRPCGLWHITLFLPVKYSISVLSKDVKCSKVRTCTSQSLWNQLFAYPAVRLSHLSTCNWIYAFIKEHFQRYHRNAKNLLLESYFETSWQDIDLCKHRRQYQWILDAISVSTEQSINVRLGRLLPIFLLAKVFLAQNIQKTWLQNSKQ